MGTRLETELEDQKADSIQQQMENERLTRSLDLALDKANASPPSRSRSQDIATWTNSPVTGRHTGPSKPNCRRNW